MMTHYITTSAIKSSQQGNAEEKELRGACSLRSGGKSALLFPQRCELCPHKDGALKRTDSGGK